MGTRGVIARRTNQGFTGRYHHWDSYPHGLGATLFTARNRHFKRDTQAMLKYLLDDHPAGWSTINRGDFAERPGYEEMGFKTTGPKCYCHGGRSETERVVTQENATEIGCEWAYVFDGDSMLVLSSEYKGRRKMIGAFGHGGSKDETYWRVVATVDLNGEVPNWEAITNYREAEGV